MSLIIIEGHKYLVSSKYNHPGEGIRGIYLSCQKGDKTKEFDYFHFTNEPWKILEIVRKRGNYNGIKYLGKVIKVANNGNFK